MASDKLVARGENFLTPTLKKRSHDDQDTLENHERDKRKRMQKNTNGSSSKKDKAPVDSSSCKRIKIISLKNIVVDKRYGYGYLKEILFKRADQKDYVFKESDFPWLNLKDIKDMYLFQIQDKIYTSDGVDEYDLINALLLHIRRIMINKRVEDMYLGVESYETKLNLTKP
nr:hypothetical protein [Tanacetum cinerariifolium]